MTSLSNDKGSGAAKAAVARSLEPSEAWMGADAKKTSFGRRSAARTPGRAVRRPKPVLKYLTLALLVGAAGAYAAGGGLDLSGQNAEQAAKTEVAAPAAASEQKTVALAQIETKRKALLDEIKKLETQRSEQQGEITELSDRRSSLSQELTELERQRQDQAAKLGGIGADAASTTVASAEDPVGDDAPMEADAAPAPTPRPDLEAVARLEQERKAKAEALAAVQRKEEDAQKRIREVKEKKAAAEREFAAGKRREREAAVRTQQEAASRLALGGAPDAQARRPTTPAAVDEDEPSGLMAGMFGGPVAGYAREQRSPYVPMQVATRFATPAAAPKRVFVHFSAYDPNGRAKAYATARRLQSEGFAVAELRPVKTRVRGNSVRFFHEGDRGSMSTLRGAVSRSVAEETSVQDFRQFDRPPSEGTLEVWLAE